jgi:hypothetical protein
LEEPVAPPLAEFCCLPEVRPEFRFRTFSLLELAKGFEPLTL